MTCWIVFFVLFFVLFLVSHLQVLYYSSILPSGFLVNEALRALVAKTKGDQSQGRKAALLKLLDSYLMSRCRWQGGSVLEA